MSIQKGTVIEESFEGSSGIKWTVIEHDPLTIVTGGIKKPIGPKGLCGWQLRLKGINLPAHVIEETKAMIRKELSP